MRAPLSVIVNGTSGAVAAAKGALPDKLRQAFAAAGTAAEVRLVEGAEIDTALREAAGEARVAVAGGDGTARGAAQALAGSDTELALLPLGTLNHLARDLELPTELNAAAALAAHGSATAIDVGEVNGERFVNNVSIGLYPSMVRNRDWYRENRGWPKWLSTFPAAWRALHRLPRHRLRIELDGKAQTVVTPLLFVGNNPYSLEGGKVGARESLRRGRLAVYAVAERSRPGLVWFALRTLAGRADKGMDFAAIGLCETLTVTPEQASIEVAMDGEILRLRSPLAFRILPRALRVVTPGSAASIVSRRTQT